MQILEETMLRGGVGARRDAELRVFAVEHQVKHGPCGATREQRVTEMKHHECL